MRKVALVVATAAAVTVGWTEAYACKGEETLFEDSFDELDPSWGNGSDNVKIVDGQLQISPEKNNNYRVVSSFSLYDDADICVATTHVAGPDDQNSEGILFWFTDANNYHLFVVSSAGNWAVFRLVNNKWRTVINWTSSPAVNQGRGKVNHLRVLTKGKVATFFVNDTELAKVHGEPPKNGQFVGVFAGDYSASERVIEAFDDFIVSRP